MLITNKHEHYMKIGLVRNQRGVAVVLEVVLVAIVLSVVGYTGYRAYTARNNKTAVTQNATASPVPSPALPDGFVASTGSSIGIKYAHPKDWGDALKEPTSSQGYYLAVYIGTKVSNVESEPALVRGHKVILVANKGTQDFTNLGRGGALWDDVGFKKEGDKYLSINRHVVNGKTVEKTVDILNPEVIKGRNTDVVLYEYNYFGNPVYVATFNLKGLYYGGSFIVDGNNETHKAQLKQLAATIEVL